MRPPGVCHHINSHTHRGGYSLVLVWRHLDDQVILSHHHAKKQKCQPTKVTKLCQGSEVMREIRSQGMQVFQIINYSIEKPIKI